MFSRHTVPGLAVLVCCVAVNIGVQNTSVCCRYEKIVVRRTMSQSVVKNHQLSNVTVDKINLFFPYV